MRWLFLLLLLLNIGYIAWGLSRPPTQPEPVVVAGRDVPPVRLLSELEAEQDSTGQSTASEQAESTPAQPDQGEAQPPKGFACYTLGPFRQLEVLSAFTRSIKDYVIEASFRSREETEQSIFQVFLRPPDGGNKAAQAIRKQLTGKKLKDHYIIASGPNAGGISLGHFSEMDRAFSLASRVQKMGFSPVVEPVLKATTIYWLDYRVQASKGIPEAVFDQHLGQDISQFDRPCT